MRCSHLVVGLLFLCVGSAMAQELSLGGVDLRRESEVLNPEEKEYNVLIGDLALDLWYVGELKYDDNVNLASGLDPYAEHDAVVLSNGIKVDADYPVTPFLFLSGDVFLEWLWALDGDHRDGIYLSSSDLLDDQYAEIAVDLLMTDQHLLTVDEKIKREKDMVDLSLYDTNTDLSYWVNIVGAQYEYAVTPLVDLGLRVEREDMWAEEELFDYLDRTVYRYTGKISLQANPDWRIQPFYTYEEGDYDYWYDPIQNKNDEINGNNDWEQHSIGIFSDYRLSPTVLLSGSIGYEWLDFEIRNSWEATDDETDGVFGSIGLAQEVTEAFRHSAAFTVDRIASVQPDANYALEYRTAYNASWQFAADWVVQGGFLWINRHESDEGEGTSNLYREEVALNYLLNAQTTVAVWYRRTDRNSDEPIREYEQNAMGLQWIYKF